MRLYLVRPAEATPGEPDELRSLTSEGRRQAGELAERLRADGGRPQFPAAVCVSLDLER